MDSNVNHVSDLIFGRWRSQILYAGVELGVFDHLDLDVSKGSEELAGRLNADPAHVYRLLRALSIPPGGTASSGRAWCMA